MDGNVEDLRKKLKELHDKEAIINEVLADASKEGRIDEHHKSFLDDLARIYEMEKALQKQIETLSVVNKEENASKSK